MKAIEQKTKRVNVILHFSNHNTLFIPHMFIKNYRVEGLHEIKKNDWRAKGIELTIDKRFLNYSKRKESLFHEDNDFEPLDRLMGNQDVVSLSETLDGMVLSYRSFKVPIEQDNIGNNVHQFVKRDKHDDIKLVINHYRYQKKP